MDPTSEIKDALERLIEQTVLSMQASQGGEGLRGSQVRMDNPNAGQEGGSDINVDQSFTTAYDGTTTLMPFMRGISGWGTDIWSG